LDDQVRGLVQDQTSDYDSDAAPWTEIVHMKNGGRKECNQQCTRNEDVNFKAKARKRSKEHADGQQTHHSYIDV
jgi:hypothetical protein